MDGLQGRRPSRWFTAGAFLVLLGAGGCGDRVPASDLLLPNSSRPVLERWKEDSGWTIEPLAQHGFKQGPLALGLVTSVAVRHDGALAVADGQSCSVTLMGRPVSSFIDRLGRCGDGPGEFRQLGAIAFNGDSLLVFDRGVSAVVVFDFEGIERRRVRAELPPGASIGAMHPLDDSTVMVGLERIGPSEGKMVLAGILDLRSGSIREFPVSDVPRAVSGSPNRIRRKPVCVYRRGDVPLLLMMNDWAFEGLAVEVPTEEMIFHFLTLAPIRLHTTRRGEPVPFLLAGVACGASGALFKTTQVASSPPNVRTTFIEFRGYDGGTKSRQTVTDANSLLHGRLVAMQGDTLFALSNAPGYPVIGEFLLRPRER